MPDYDFRSLSPIDFEILSRDLLQKELGITLESFKPGRDLGIDFRFWPTQDHKLIVQCKHYLDSGFDSLLRKLTKRRIAKNQKARSNSLYFDHLRPTQSLAARPDKERFIAIHSIFRRYSRKG